MRITDDSGRAFYSTARKEVRLYRKRDTGYHETKKHSEALIHEAAHHIELNSSKELVARSKAFIERRKLPGETLTPIFEGNNRELGIKDKFFKHYCGKYYPNATEILSMGFERMAREPAKFLTDDPDYFKFINDVMWGNI